MRNRHGASLSWYATLALATCAALVTLACQGPPPGETEGTAEAAGAAGEEEQALIDEENGKATLYYYEATQFDSPTEYPVLTGHIDPPDNERFTNLRQGELNFSRFSVKLGVRFKF